MKLSTFFLGITLAGMGLAALLSNPKDIDNFIDDTGEGIRNFFRQTAVIDYVNSLDFSAREKLYNEIRILDAYSK